MHNDRPPAKRVWQAIGATPRRSIVILMIAPAESLEAVKGTRAS
jgi:hypothetical protein